MESLQSIRAIDTHQKFSHGSVLSSDGAFTLPGAIHIESVLRGLQVSEEMPAPLYEHTDELIAKYLLSADSISAG